MIDYIDITISYNGTDASAGSGTAWLSVEQDAIPLEHELATEDDIKSMLDMVLSGHSATQAVTKCPKTRDSAAGVHNYTAKVFVHKSKIIDNYEFEATKDGKIIKAHGPLPKWVRKAETLEIDWEVTHKIDLKDYKGNIIGQWRAVNDTIQSRWDFCYQSDGSIIQPDVICFDGYINLSSSVIGDLRVSGLAECDSWSIDIEHKIGQTWNSSVWVEVRWPIGAPRKDQIIAEVEVRLPQCLIDKWSECPDEDEDGDGIPDEDEDGDGIPDDEEGDTSISESGPYKAFFNACTNELMYVTRDDRK